MLRPNTPCPFTTTSLPKLFPGMPVSLSFYGNPGLDSSPRTATQRDAHHEYPTPIHRPGMLPCTMYRCGDQFLEILDSLVFLAFLTLHTVLGLLGTYKGYYKGLALACSSHRPISGTFSRGGHHPTWWSYWPLEGVWNERHSARQQLWGAHHTQGTAGGVFDPVTPAVAH